MEQQNVCPLEKDKFSTSYLHFTKKWNLKCYYWTLSEPFGELPCYFDPFCELSQHRHEIEYIDSLPQLKSNRKRVEVFFKRRMLVEVVKNTRRRTLSKSSHHFVMLTLLPLRNPSSINRIHLSVCLFLLPRNSLSVIIQLLLRNIIWKTLWHNKMRFCCNTFTLIHNACIMSSRLRERRIKEYDWFTAGHVIELESETSPQIKSCRAETKVHTTMKFNSISVYHKKVYKDTIRGRNYVSVFQISQQDVTRIPSLIFLGRLLGWLQVAYFCSNHQFSS